MKLDNEEQRALLTEIVEGMNFQVTGKDIETISEKIGGLRASIKAAKLEKDSK